MAEQGETVGSLGGGRASGARRARTGVLLLAGASALERPRPRRAGVRLVCLLVAAAGVPMVTGAFASNITLGSGSIEFGQGSQTMAVCDSSFTVEVGYAWQAATSSFVVDQIVVSGIDTSACAGKSLELSAWSSSGQVDVCGVGGVCSTDGLSHSVAVAASSSLTLSVPDGIAPGDIVRVAVTTK